MQNSILPMDLFQKIIPILSWGALQNMGCICKQINYEIVIFARKRIINEINNLTNNPDLQITSTHIEKIECCPSLKVMKIIKVATLSKIFYSHYYRQVNFSLPLELNNFIDLENAIN